MRNPNITDPYDMELLRRSKGLRRPTSPLPIAVRFRIAPHRRFHLLRGRLEGFEATCLGCGDNAEIPKDLKVCERLISTVQFVNNQSCLWNFMDSGILCHLDWIGQHVFDKGIVFQVFIQHKTWAATSMACSSFSRSSSTSKSSSSSSTST